MRRWTAILILFLASFYFGATSLDQCSNGIKDDCAPICHIFCADGCATVPVPEAPVPPSPDPLPRSMFVADTIENFVSLNIEPEKEPPRA